MTGSIAIEACRRLLAAAEAAGADRAQLLAACGLEHVALEVEEGRVALDRHYELWRAALEATGDRALPVHVARGYRLDTYRVLAFACMTAPDLRECLRRLVRFTQLWMTGERYELVEGDRGGVSRLVVRQDATRRHVGHHLAVESALAKIVLGGREAAAQAWTPLEVRFAHAAPADAAALEALFDCAVRFGCGVDELVLSDAALELPMAKADPGLAQFFERHAEELLAAQRDGGSLSARARRVLVDVLRDGELGMDRVARRLGLSPRTFRRRLAEDGTRFRDLLDDARRELSRRYLLDGDLSANEVAYLLGYSEPSAFFRAFRRWTGQTPEEFRRATQTGSKAAP